MASNRDHWPFDSTFTVRVEKATKDRLLEAAEAKGKYIRDVLEQAILPIVVCLFPVLIWSMLMTMSSVAATPKVELLRYQKVFGVPRVYKCPRPAPDEMHVPLQTSLFFQLIVRDSSKEDTVIPGSVTVTLTPENGKPICMLKEGSQFAPGFSGWLMPGSSVDYSDHPALSVYISPEQP